MSDIEQIQEPDQSQMGMGAKLINILTAPSEVYAHIRERVGWPDWIFPVLIAVLLTGTAGIIRAPYNLNIARNAIEAQRDKFIQPDMATEQQQNLQQRFDAQEQKQETHLTPPQIYWRSYGRQIITIILSVLILAGLYYFAGNTILGGQSKYGKVLAVVALPQMVTAVQGLYQIVMTWILGQVDIPSSLAVVLGYDTASIFKFNQTQQALFTFLSHFDVFTIWRMILYIIGFSIVYKVSRGKASSVVLGFWALWIIITTVGTFLFAGIGG